ncbi:methyltransferase domain-containing protein [Bradyrhizobium sp. CIAT3101]|uniref:methyltransferase domain-containing protein n=1 Tax=Bradyrhizobium sp. CIAT3101 TaxID=439387 RepID=UPI0024B0BF57|nr:methyltransferase domain-containing protein [Bradyrhizobium sp. CIAT3101]WFU79129.1 methyltransferase domain-containing protein [Bradyrhizobium sp. CIAT3101]
MSIVTERSADETPNEPAHARRKTPIMARVRPEVVAGGIVRDDGEVDFLVRANALLQPDMTVLDFGAGRGAIFLSGKWELREHLAKFQGKVRKVIGVDADEGVLEHPFLDEKHVIKVDQPLPLADESVDLIIAHWVFEHIQDPSRLAAEFFRVLKPGGWICARTPHRWSYVGIVAGMLPEGLQRGLLKWIKPGFEAQDKFPTAYKLNSFSALRKHFSDAQWLDCSYGINSAPRYHFENRWMFKGLSAYQSLAWPKTDIIVLIQKRA